ncbi:MAG: SIS domain-containing protein [Deltaproteobacteria bacterium]|nr:SIS domain-containing protein [Deltaproteobacteria bacterium]
MRSESKLINYLYGFFRKVCSFFSMNVYFGKHITSVPENSLVFFPYCKSMVCCGIAGIVSIKKNKKTPSGIDLESLGRKIHTIVSRGYLNCRKNNLPIETHYLGGDQNILGLFETVRSYKADALFPLIYCNKDIQTALEGFAGRLKGVIEEEAKFLSEFMGRLKISETDVMSSRIEKLKDIHWCLTMEIAGNIKKIRVLTECFHKTMSPDSIRIFKKINAVLNSIDRLEVRGRDSAGISLMFITTEREFERYEQMLRKAALWQSFVERADPEVLKNKGIHIRKGIDSVDKTGVSITFTYKVAAEVGSLGDNIRYLREQIQQDQILHILTDFPHTYHTVLSHTRWASMGAITEANCHPVDNRTRRQNKGQKGWIHVCLNGDIDNYLELKAACEQDGHRIHEEITTDTKIIPLQIEKYIHEGHDIGEAFRLAVNDFEGSHAISMHTDLAPGKLFLAQRGSGQAIFVGIAEDHYMPTSEVYGFVEETPFFIKMEGDQIVRGRNGNTQGQIIIISQTSSGGLNGIRGMYYDGTPIRFQQKDVRYTEITSRDIDRQGYAHYFLKEISEAPVSVERTLQNRWKKENDSRHYVLVLDERVVPAKIKSALQSNEIRRVFFIGQGTAGVAALACSNILNHYLNDPSCLIGALKASELSGFNLAAEDGKNSMADTLVVAISQSGTTADTNRAVDMVKERGGHTIAIVNRRDSDITFKVDGVFYTSSGRDIEMSVASTKAFYSQIVAGALLGLYIARIKNRRDKEFESREIKQLLRLPAHMREVISNKSPIAASAKRLAPQKTYWAVVGSGPNKASADEIRIKLSELCYKTISSDYVEDKKHIDLSSEPLIIVCAAGARDSVIGDIIKDTAIFNAHKATPIVIANQGEHRFDSYAADVFHVPTVDEHLAPVLNTLVGHIWGYYAALAINEGSRMLFEFQNEMRGMLEEYSKRGLDAYEIILEESFREKIARFYKGFRKIKEQAHFPADNALASDLTLLLKYLSGRLPVSDFELDFGKKGTAHNMLDTLFASLGECINRMTRPIDAIKHQAKTVTVGTSRITDRIEGILFNSLYDHNFNIFHLTPSNVIVLRNLQGIIERVNGSILYRIHSLNLLGEPTDATTIEIVEKKGMLKSLPSRVETDNELKGTKRIIVKQGNVYIGMGRKDGRSILIVPLISDAPSKSNIIEHLLLMNISFKQQVPLSVKTKALGGKYEHIKNLVLENSIPWQDQYLDQVAMKDLFGISAEKVAELIIMQVAEPRSP